MGSVRHPRGRLPRRVYWVRRAVVLGLALALVFGIGRLLGGTGSDDPGAAAVQSGNGTTAQGPGSTVPAGPVVPSQKLPTKAAKAPLLPPSGDCEDDEISVLPSVPRAWAGAPITIQLQLTGTQPACTFEVSPETVVVKIASGSDRIWSSQDCPKSIPTTSVVVRSSQPVVVPVVWSARRSDEQCSSTADWALLGFYHVYAAALGSTPSDVQFEVTRAAPKVVTRTPKPRPSTTASAPAKASATAPATAAAKPSSSPSPSVSGKGSKCGGDNAAGSC
jgi:hypothetical protein